MTRPIERRDATAVRHPSAGPASTPFTGRAIARFIIIFLLVSAAGFGLENYMMDRNSVVGLRSFVATVGAWIPNLFGLHAKVIGTKILTASQGMEVTPECSGIEPTAIFLAGVLAFPSSRRTKVIGIILGLLGVGVLNILRVSFLVTISELKPLWFENSHTALTHLFPLIAVLPLWLVWLTLVMKERRAAIQSRDRQTA